MKQNSLSLPIVGGSLSLICFFLPWLKIDMSALGIDPIYSNIDGPIYVFGFQFVIRGSFFESLTFLAILVILAVCIYMLKQKTPWKSRMSVLICSSYGCIYVSISLIVSIITNINMVSRTNEFTSPEANLGNFASLQIGMFGVIIGFLLAFIGAWNIPKSDAAMENK